MAMLPGTYIQKRRQAADLSIDDVVAMLPTEPRVTALERAAWLRQIEAGEVPIGGPTVRALRFAFAFDPMVLQRLEEARLDPTACVPRICRACACSQFDACGDGCSWIAPDLCSACPDDPADADALPGPDEVAVPGEPSPANDQAEGVAA